MEKRLMTPEDILNLSVPGSLSAAADGETLVFSLKRPSGEDGYQSRIMRFSHATGRLEQVGEGTQPKLSPDGTKVACLQGEELVVPDLAGGGENRRGPYRRCQDLAWSPDGGKILFTFAKPLPRLPQGLPELPGIVWVDRLKFKSDGEGLCDGSYRHVGYFDLETGVSATVPGERSDFACPSFLDSDTIISSSILYQCDNSDHASVMVYHIPTGQMRSYLGPGGPITRMAASHSGRCIVFLSHDNSQWEATNFKLYTLDLETGEYRCRTAGFDRSIGNYASSKAGINLDGYHLEWSQDDQTVYTLVQNKSVCGIYAMDMASGRLTVCHEPQGVIYDFAAIPGGWYFLISQDREFAAVCRLVAGRVETIWREAGLDDCRLSGFQPFTFPGFDGQLREGFYMPPLVEQKGVVLDIHGGPHYSYGVSFSIDAQLYAANGYGLVFCNPAGSQGYGQAVAQASKHDWGGKDFAEIMDCVKTACETFGLDQYPWAVVGGSYGGYMVNWAIGHTNFFHCAVSERGSCNRYSQSGTSDCAYRYGEFEFTGYAWDSPDHYRFHSPITYVREIQTPLLLVHGEQDMNCSISQSEEMYSACKLMGKEVYFVRFPGESHGFATQGKPTSRLARHRLLLWWLQRYLG